MENICNKKMHKMIKEDDRRLILLISHTDHLHED